MEPGAEAGGTWGDSSAERCGLAFQPQDKSKAPGVGGRARSVRREKGSPGPGGWVRRADGRVRVWGPEAACMGGLWRCATELGLSPKHISK